MGKPRATGYTNLCPCGSQAEFTGCCARYLESDAIPQTAEQLMRSRYSGFVLCNEHYLLDTWHPETRPSKINFDPEQRWLGLSVRATEAGMEADSTGLVEYIARYKISGKGYRLHEISRFLKIDGRWFYTEGRHL